MATMATKSNALEERRRALGMSHATLAERSGLSLPTVNRILSGRMESASFANVRRLADALEMGLVFDVPHRGETARLRQAVRKAKRLAGMVQGTSGLEAQAVNRQTLRAMTRGAAGKLLSGSKRRLWAV